MLSGPGLLNLHRFTHSGQGCDAVDGVEAIEAPARVTRLALEGSCAEALSLFVEAYGAEGWQPGAARGRDVRCVCGGGIAPKILPALQDGRFIEAFRAKGPMSELAAKIPVNVILAAETGLVGTAVATRELVLSEK